MMVGVPSGTVLNSRTSAEKKCGAISRRARIQGSWIVVSLNSRPESNKREEKMVGVDGGGGE